MTEIAAGCSGGGLLLVDAVALGSAGCAASGLVVG